MSVGTKVQLKAVKHDSSHLFGPECWPVSVWEKKTHKHIRKKEKHKRSARGVNLKQGADLPAASHSGSSWPRRIKLSHGVFFFFVAFFPLPFLSGSWFMGPWAEKQRTWICLKLCGWGDSHTALWKSSPVGLKSLQLAPAEARRSSSPWPLTRGRDPPSHLHTDRPRAGSLGGGLTTCHRTKAA